MLRATLAATVATATLALLLMLTTEAEAARVFPRTQRRRQAKEVVDTPINNGDGTLQYVRDEALNRTLAIHGAGNGSMGVAAFDIGILFPPKDDLVIPDPTVNATEGSGPGAPVGYCLVENHPRCYFQLGSAYCPAPASGFKWTDNYMSWLERTSQVLTNAARIDPANFRTIYNGGKAYSCSTTTRAPLRYAPNVQQAAKKQSQILSDPSCPFQHDTCSKYCSLYGGCDWVKRLSKYEPNWTGIGENIAMTYESAAGDPFYALGQWLGSSGHCSNIFSGQYNHMGTGARGRMWTQNFVTRSAYTSNPFYDGTHYRHSAHTNGQLRFMVSFKASAAPRAISVYVNGVKRPLTRQLGTATQGVYVWDTTPPSSNGCWSYYFHVVLSNGATHTLPQTGSYQTVNIAGCTNNWVAARSGTSTAPTPVAPAPAPQPAPVPAPQPTPRPPAPAPAPAPIPAPAPQPFPAPAPAPIPMPPTGGFPLPPTFGDFPIPPTSSLLPLIGGQLPSSPPDNLAPLIGDLIPREEQTPVQSEGKGKDEEEGR